MIVRLKLYFFENNDGNFGDALNPWFWSKVAPSLWDDNNDNLLLGIGSIINHKLPQAASTTVFGSGAGYGELPKGFESWRVYCVRGPLTAKKLGLDDSYAVIDPAALCPRLYQPELVEKRYPVSFIPHYMTAKQGDWPSVCAAAGIHYISPTDPPLTVIDQIVSSGRVITEAMHGAILADSYRVPWMAASLDESLHPKWQDWLLTVGLSSCSTLSLQQVWKGNAEQPLTYRVKNRLKRSLLPFKPSFIQWSPPVPLKSSFTVFDTQVKRLKDAAQSDDFMLSSTSILNSKLDRLETLLAQLIADNQHFTLKQSAEV
ncbi:MAG: succinoglycan biosynthesis protein ExoV [Motiliproteus sp.]|jgi:succinoglycan biosynthesis protein ExoV